CQRITGALHLSDQPVDLVAPEQQLAGARRIGTHMRRRSRERAHMRADQHDFAVLDHDVRFLEIRPSRAYRLDLPALERKSSLKALLDKIVVKRFSIFDNAHVDPGTCGYSTRCNA